jgi:uncharacterized repeat protein (TIGR03837 family)
MAGQQWDIFCRVVDNYGDAGVCWRLARALAARGQTVRLMIDDATPLSWMAPRGAPGVQVLPWPGPSEADEADEAADVVIEAFGCDPPEAFVAQMAARALPPVWINLEYLSAEGYVERSHRLPSPQRNGLTKWFFFPGFTAGHGGAAARDSSVPADFDRVAWLTEHDLAPREGERVVSLFCYDNPALPALLQSLAASPTLLLLTPGYAQGSGRQRAPGVRLATLPWQDQEGFDHLLGPATSTSCEGRTRWCAPSGPARRWSGRPIRSRTARTLPRCRHAGAMERPARGGRGCGRPGTAGLDGLARPA